MKIAVIDNLDSFTYNLVHYLEALDCNVTVFRIDELEIDELEDFDQIVLSPGPGLPSPLLLEIIKTYGKLKKILGVCLGQQAIAQVFGGKLKNLDKVFHGIGTVIMCDESNALFANIGKNMTVGRYHSWTIDKTNFPEELDVIAADEFGEIMAIKHRNYNLYGVQFHPESVLTPMGKTLLQNWLAI